MVDDLVVIGKACAARRKELGLTQTQLANKIGTRQHHIANFEAGKQNIAIRTFIAILGSLNLHLDLRPKDGDKPACLYSCFGSIYTRL